MGFSESCIIIISSIPGRIRLRIKRLEKHNTAILGVCNYIQSTKGIISASGNLNSSSILIFYDDSNIKKQQILKILADLDFRDIKDLVPADYGGCFIKRHLINVIREKNLFLNEYKLAARLTGLGAILALLAYVSTSSLSVPVSILILSNPIIFFAIKLKVYYHLLKRSWDRCIYLNSNIFSIDLDHKIILDGNLLEVTDSGTKSNGLSINNYHTSPKVSSGRISELINPHGMKLVYGLRSNGFINISAFFKGSCRRDRLLANFAGIETIISSQSGLPKTNSNILIFLDSTFDSLDRQPRSITICISDLPAKYFGKFDVTLNHSSIIDIPSILIMPIRYGRIISTYENAALTANMCMLLLSILKYIDPFNSIVLYLLNMIINTTMLGRTLALKGG